MSDSRQATLLTGGNGYLGSLVAAVLLFEQRRRLVLPIRATTPETDCLARIAQGIRALGASGREVDLLIRGTTITGLPTPDRIGSLDDIAAAMEIDEVVHCAGCVDYFDKRRLHAANVELTSNLLAAARRWRVRRFVYLSSAYCSGYQRDSVAECLHADPDPANEPTEYTRSKRLAEWMIADSDVPFLIVRPSVVIGDSRSGVYGGQPYGLYQLWRAFEGLLTREYSPAWHVVAPPSPVNLVHQDMFQSAFLALYRGASPNTVAHLVSDHARNPTLRELFLLWTEVYRPVEIYCYDCIDEVPLVEIPTRQRRFLEFAAKNLEIASWLWRFQDDHMTRMRTAGLRIADTTIDTVAACQRWYVDRSDRLREHLRTHADRQAIRTRVVERGSRSRGYHEVPAR